MAFGRPKKLYSEEELYDYAVNALARRMRSVAELKRLLRVRVEAETELGTTLIELIIRRLKDQGYLNDARYAAAYSSYRRDNEKFGSRRVVTDLKAKGVHGDVIDAAISTAYGEIDEEKQARDYLHRKRLRKPKDQKDTARIFRHLLRAGFSSKTIFKILKKWDVDEEVLSTLESEAGCTEIMRLLTAARDAINGTMAEVVEDHIQPHMIDANRKPTRKESVAAGELIDVLRSYIK